MRRLSAQVEEEEEEEEKGEEETGVEKKKEEVEDPDKIKPVVFIGLFITSLFCLGFCIFFNYLPVRLKFL